MVLLAREIRETNGRGVDLWRVPEVKTTELAHRNAGLDHPASGGILNR